jgi:hypothetical protein
LFLPRPHVRQRRWGRVWRTPHDVTFLGCAPRDRGTVPYLFTAAPRVKRCGIDSTSTWIRTRRHHARVRKGESDEVQRPGVRCPQHRSCAA